MSLPLLIALALPSQSSENEFSGLWLGSSLSANDEPLDTVVVQVLDRIAFWYDGRCRWLSIEPASTQSRLVARCHWEEPRESDRRIELALSSEKDTMNGIGPDGRRVVFHKVGSEESAKMGLTGQSNSMACVAYRHGITLPFEAQVESSTWTRFYFNQIATELLGAAVFEQQRYGRQLYVFFTPQDPDGAKQLARLALVRRIGAVTVSLAARECLVSASVPIDTTAEDLAKTKELMSEFAHACIGIPRGMMMEVKVDASSQFFGETPFDRIRPEFVRGGAVDFDRVWAHAVRVGQQVEGVEFNKDRMTKSGNSASIKTDFFRFPNPTKGLTTAVQVEVEMKVEGMYLQTAVNAHVFTRHNAEREFARDRNFFHIGRRPSAAAKDLPPHEQVFRAILQAVSFEETPEIQFRR